MTRRRSTEGSLDLLLDTITNTFGSILFLTMLVALLLRTTSPPTSDDRGSAAASDPPLSALEQAQRSAAIDELSAEIDRLTRALAAMEFDDPDQAWLKAALATATDKTRRVVQEDAALTATIAEAQRMIADTAIEAARIDAALARAEEDATMESARRHEAEQRAAELAQAAEDPDLKSQDAGTVTTQIPPVFEPLEAEKQQVGLLMRYGRLYMMHRWEHGQRLGPNTDHFVIMVKPDGQQTAIARPDAGVPVQGPQLRNQLVDMLAGFPSDRWVVAIAVHRDSFGIFQAVKEILISLGYKYEPLLPPLRDTGGSGRQQ
jgi:hypothetical protein